MPSVYLTAAAVKDSFTGQHIFSLMLYVFLQKRKKRGAEGDTAAVKESKTPQANKKANTKVRNLTSLDAMSEPSHGKLLGLMFGRTLLAPHDRNACKTAGLGLCLLKWKAHESSNCNPAAELAAWDLMLGFASNACFLLYRLPRQL